MKCPFCKKPDSRVIDSRAADDGATIRRRRECGECGRRFTTYEVVEKLPLMVVKRDNRREPFNRDKLLTGIIRSCDKRDISMEQITNFVAEIERDIARSRKCRRRRSVKSSWSGSRTLMKSLISALPRSIGNSMTSRTSLRSWKRCVHDAERSRNTKGIGMFWIIV